MYNNFLDGHSMKTKRSWQVMNNFSGLAELVFRVKYGGIEERTHFIYGYMASDI